MVLLQKAVSQTMHFMIHSVFNFLYGYHLKSNSKEKCQIPSELELNSLHEHKPHKFVSFFMLLAQ